MASDSSVDFVHRFIPGALASAPTILALHGTGGDEHDLVPLARMIDGDAAILSPRGRVLEQGKPRFFRRLAEGVFDLDDLREQTRALGDFIVSATARYHVDPANVIALGYSNGANIAASILLTRADLLAGAMLLRPMMPFEPDTMVSLPGTPVLISAGSNDPIVPRASTERLAAALAGAGAKVTTIWQTTGHALTPPELEQVTAWWQTTFGA